MDMETLTQEIRAIREEVHRAVVGYEDAVDDLVVALLARGHVLLEGVPGVAKTTLAKSFAGAMGASFRRIQFTQDLLPADITGHYFFDQRAREFQLRQGPVFADVVLADEINRAPPKTQSALLEAMEERQVTIEGNTLPLRDDFMVIATMNPIDFEGVYRLPEAQLDRFLVRSRMSYLPPEEERRMLGMPLAPPRDLRAVVDPGFAKRAQAAVHQVHAEASVVDYLHAICLATRSDPNLALGASPRAAQRFLVACRARALLEGRTYVVPDDVKRVAPPVLNHRLLPTADAELAGIGIERVLEGILASVPPPDAPALAARG